jgi:hypothetical protein
MRNGRNRKLTGIDNDQDSLPSLVALCQLLVLDIKDIGNVVEVVVQLLVSLDVNGALGGFGNGSGHFRHDEWMYICLRLSLTKEENHYNVSEWGQDNR